MMDEYLRLNGIDEDLTQEEKGYFEDTAHYQWFVLKVRLIELGDSIINGLGLNKFARSVKRFIFGRGL